MLVLVFKREFFLSRLQNVLDTWQNQQNDMCVQRRLIHPVWSVFAVRTNLGTHWAHSEDWSDWADSQADLSLRWAHRSFCWFCHGTAYFMSVIKATKSIIHVYHVQRTRAVSKKYRLCVRFFGWYCLPNLALLLYGGSRKGKNCTEPQVMSPGDV